jgi:hypothetical protein
VRSGWVGISFWGWMMRDEEGRQGEGRTLVVYV